MYNTDEYIMLVLPELNTNLYPIDTLHLSFWYQYFDVRESVSPFILGVMTDPTDVTTFEQITEIPINATLDHNWYHVGANLNGYTGTGKYIAILTNTVDVYWSAMIDDITLEAISILPSDITVTPNNPAMGGASGSSIGNNTIFFNAFPNTGSHFVYWMAPDGTVLSTDEAFYYTDTTGMVGNIIAVFAADSCVAVTDLMVSDVWSDQLDVQWSDPIGGTVYTLLQATTVANTPYEVIDSNIVAGSDGNVSYTVQNLTPGTSYTFAVRGICPDNQMDTVEFTATTAASAVHYELLCNQTSSYTWHGVDYPDAGGYESRNDSLYLYILTGDTAATACDSFDWYEYEGITADGDYTHTFTTANGCDSVVTLHLTVNQSTHNVYDTTVCESFEWHGMTYTNSDTYTYEYTNVTGCVSVDTLHLTVNHGTHNVYDTTVCEIFEWHGMTYTNSDTYTYEYTNATGCVSVDTLHLTIINCCSPVENLVVDGVSDTTVSLSWTGTAASYTVMNGNAEVATGVTETHYTVPGLTPATNYTFSVIANCSATESSAPVSINATTDSAHCDILLNLGVQDVWSDQADIHWTDPTNGSIVYTLLQLTSDPTHPYQVIVTGLHADATGMVSYTIPNLVPGQSYTFAVAAACTRNMVDTIEIVITTESTPVHNESACYVPYEWHGVEYFVPGEYYSRNDTLFLEVLYGDTTAIACDSFDWYEYLGITASGDYIHVFTSATACDSVVTLHLTVNHGTHNVYDTTVCESYEWHGVTYTNSDTYTYEYTNATGCVSVDTLHLTIINCCSPVENLVVDGVSDTTVSLSWTGSAAYYTVINGTAQVATNITDTHYTVSGLTASTNYIFSIIANCSATSSSVPVSISATTSEAELTVNITVVPNDTAMSLYVLGSGSYHVGDTAVLAAVANEGFYFVNWEYNNAVLSADNPFFMVVTGDVSGTIYAIFDTTNCEPVVNLHYSDTTSTSVNLVWDDPNNNGATYAVGYFDGDNVTIVETGITITNYNVTGLTPNTTYYFVVRTDCSESGMVYSDVLVVTTPSQNSIASFDESSKWVLYPNPTTDRINVQFASNNEQMNNVEIQLYDMYGKWLNTWKITGENTEIDLSSYASSVYFIKVVEGQRMLGVRKIVKQ